MSPLCIHRESPYSLVYGFKFQLYLYNRISIIQNLIYKSEVQMSHTTGHPTLAKVCKKKGFLPTGLDGRVTVTSKSPHLFLSLFLSTGVLISTGFGVVQCCTLSSADMELQPHPCVLMNVWMNT